MKKIFLIIALLFSVVMTSQQQTSVYKWNAAITYNINDLVSVDGVIYKATVSTTNDTPPSANWEGVGSGDFMSDGSVSMTGALNGGEIEVDQIAVDLTRTATTQLGGFFKYQVFTDGFTSFYGTGVGPYALDQNEGLTVVGIGQQSLELNTGQQVIGIGKHSAYQNIGYQVVGVGSYAASRNEGDYLMAIGFECGSFNTGDNNVGIGYQAIGNTTGNYNVGIGRNALASASGSYNIAIGALASDGNPMSYNYTTSIGYNSNPTQDHQVMLGHTLVSSIRVGNPNYTPSDNSDLATKKYVDDNAGGGGTGDVTKVGTPVDQEIGVWTGDGTLKGDTNLLWNGSKLTVLGDLTVAGGQFALSGNPTTSSQVGNRNYNDLRYSFKSVDAKAQAGSYTTISADNGKHIDMSGGTTITLSDDAAAFEVDEQLHIFNNTGVSLTFAYGTGDTAIQGTLPDLADGQYAWCTLKSANLWSVIVGGAAGGGGTIGGSITDNQIAVGAATANSIEGSPELTYSGGILGILPTTGAAMLNLNPDLGQGTISILQTGDYDMNFELVGTADYSFFAGAAERLNISEIGVLNINQSYSLPNVDGTIGQHLETNGSGVVTWEDAGGGLANVVEDLTPELGGDLDAKNKDINNVFELGFNSTSTPNDGIPLGITYYNFATAERWSLQGDADKVDLTHFTEVNLGATNTTDPEVHVTEDSVDIVNVTFSDGADPTVDFGGSAIYGAGYLNTNELVTGTLAESKANTVVFATAAIGDITLTIPDTWTQKSGAQITIVNVSNYIVTIDVSGTATLNGSGTNTVILGASDNTGNEAVQFIQSSDGSDDWYTVGKY